MAESFDVGLSCAEFFVGSDSDGTVGSDSNSMFSEFFLHKPTLTGTTQKNPLPSHKRYCVTNRPDSTGITWPSQNSQNPKESRTMDAPDRAQSPPPHSASFTIAVFQQLPLSQFHIHRHCSNQTSLH